MISQAVVAISTEEDTVGGPAATRGQVVTAHLRPASIAPTGVATGVGGSSEGVLYAAPDGRASAPGTGTTCLASIC